MRAAIVAITTAAVLALAVGRAHAYPQFQLTHAESCSACHYAPAGGGLLTPYGQEVLGDDVASRGGDARFLSGLWAPPDWLQLGGDFRVGGGVFGRGGAGPAVDPLYILPMQGDLYARAAKGALSVEVTGGLRGGLYGAGDRTSMLQLREHYVMWKAKGDDEKDGLYVRAGRFQAPYGLRLVEHTAYTRRYTGNYLFAETYGVSIGDVEPTYEVHATAFVHDFLRDPVELGHGAALYAEDRPSEHTAVGVSARYAQSRDESRTQGGLTGKLYLEPQRLLLQGEVDGIRQNLFAGPNRAQLVAYLLGTYVVKQGWTAELGLGHYDEDLAVKDLDRDAVDVNVHYVPWTHLELALDTRVQTIGLGAGGATSYFALLQVHYRM